MIIVMIMMMATVVLIVMEMVMRMLVTRMVTVVAGLQLVVMGMRRVVMMMTAGVDGDVDEWRCWLIMAMIGGCVDVHVAGGGGGAYCDNEE